MSEAVRYEAVRYEGWAREDGRGQWLRLVKDSHSPADCLARLRRATASWGPTEICVCPEGHHPSEQENESATGV